MRSVRNCLVLSSAVALAACGGGTGVETVGSSAPPTGTATPTPTDVYSQFTNPVDAKTYAGIGGEQVYEYSTDTRGCCNQQQQVYAGNASTVRNSSISLSYDPRDAIFTLIINDPKSGANVDTRFQDPASRTNFTGAVEPQWGTPNLTSLPGTLAAYNNTNIQFLQAGDGDPRSPYGMSGSGFVNPGDNTHAPTGAPGSSYNSTTLFYEKPGSTTKYVSFAGYVRNALSWDTITVGTTTADQAHWHLERGAFAYGAQTTNANVPTAGSGTFSGEMLATMVYNPTIDGKNGAVLPTYFQWLTGTSTVKVDFGAKTVDLLLQGVVLDGQFDYNTAAQNVFLPQGTTFDGHGSAAIDLANTGGFLGSFKGGSWVFHSGGKDYAVSVEGSSIDGAFFGPKAEEIGGGFRVVGGIPDQRIDILGAFTGKK